MASLNSSLFLLLRCSSVENFMRFKDCQIFKLRWSTDLRSGSGVLLFTTVDETPPFSRTWSIKCRAIDGLRLSALPSGLTILHSYYPSPSKEKGISVILYDVYVKGSFASMALSEFTHQDILWATSTSAHVHRDS